MKLILLHFNFFLLSFPCFASLISYLVSFLSSQNVYEVNSPVSLLCFSLLFPSFAIFFLLCFLLRLILTQNVSFSECNTPARTSIVDNQSTCRMPCASQNEEVSGIVSARFGWWTHTQLLPRRQEFVSHVKPVAKVLCLNLSKVPFHVNYVFDIGSVVGRLGMLHTDTKGNICAWIWYWGTHEKVTICNELHGMRMCLFFLVLFPHFLLFLLGAFFLVFFVLFFSHFLLLFPYFVDFFKILFVPLFSLLVFLCHFHFSALYWTLLVLLSSNQDHVLAHWNSHKCSQPIRISLYTLTAHIV